MFRLPRKLMHTLIVLKTHEEVSKQLCTYITYINWFIRQNNAMAVSVATAMTLKSCNIRCHGTNQYHDRSRSSVLFCLPLKWMLLFIFLNLWHGKFVLFILSKGDIISFQKSVLFPKVLSHSLNNEISAQVTRGWG